MSCRGRIGPTVILFLLLITSVVIRGYPHPNATSLVLLDNILRDDDCVSVPVSDPYSNPCQSYFGDDTYEWCESTCEYGSCTCCPDDIGCPPPTNQDDCKFVPQVYDGTDPCLRYFGSNAYEYCPKACQNGYCKYCQNSIGCPTTVVWPDLTLCKFVPEVAYSANPCLSYFGVDTYELCVHGCRESKCLCCEYGEGCPTHQVAKNSTF